MKMTIGQVIVPPYEYDLEASLRVQRSLVRRASDEAWRFRGRWVVTGPHETMMGKPSCGRSGAGLEPSPLTELNLPVSLGLDEMVRRVNHWILRAIADYPGFAELSESVACLPFGNCGSGVARLAALNGRKTARKLNQCWNRARLIRDVRLVCSCDGIYFDADVSFNRRPTESRWSVFALTRQACPRWNERGRLAKWLERCGDVLESIIKEKRRGEETGD